MTLDELRNKWFSFWKERGHAVIQSASLIPENDPTVLFTTAGMHPLVPYLLGQGHPAGTRLCDVQKCVRTGDIDDVGDPSHLTFFEMLGNWSLGDYFKKEAIHWSWEFLTGKEYLGIDPERLAFSVFAGDEDCPRDDESARCWEECGVKKERIFFLPKENNWWPAAGIPGPCGPDTEMFIDTGKPACGPDCSPACDCGKYLEIWNNVFMQYNRAADGTLTPLERKNVDTGMGLERTVCVLTGKKSVYETEAFSDILGKIAQLSGKKYGQDEELTRAFRIIADHIRCSVFILGDQRGVTPSNVDQGYVLRRLIRRAVRYGKTLELPAGSYSQIAKVIIDKYKQQYPELDANQDRIIKELDLEEDRFARTLNQGLKEYNKAVSALAPGDCIDGITAFHLYDTFGFPIEMTVELAAENSIKVDVPGFESAFKEHQAKSHAGAQQRFKGGLADQSEQTARLHTATHLLHSALREVLGRQVAQKGSNITPERLRFDFSFERKMTPDEIKRVEELVNQAIAANAPIVCEEMPLEQARQSGAIGLFESKYGENVKVYTMGGFSKEICGGPHAQNTGELISFKIKKEESSSAGVRRIKAVIGAAQ